MSIYKDSYQTTIGIMYNMSQIEKAIREAIIKDNLGNMNLNVSMIDKVKPIYIISNKDSLVNIPLFAHPLALSHNHIDYLCTDLRMYMRKEIDETLEIERNVRNLIEYNFSKSRSILNLVWLDHGVNQLKNGLSFARKVFTVWLSDVIGNNFALDPGQKIILSVITSLYYQSLFVEKNAFTDDIRESMVLHTIKDTNAPDKTVQDVLAKLHKIKDMEANGHTFPLESIADYCQAVIQVIGSIGLKDFNLPTLLTIIRNSWYGVNAKEILPVALEHPPTWCAIIYAALTDRTYNNSVVARYCERLAKRGGKDEFLKSYIGMTMEHLIAREELNNALEQLENHPFFKSA